MTWLYLVDCEKEYAKYIGTPGYNRPDEQAGGCR